MRVMDAEQLDFESGLFDVVLCGFSLFFFPDLSRAVGEMNRVLRSEGVLATSTFGKGDVLVQDHPSRVECLVIQDGSV